MKKTWPVVIVAAISLGACMPVLADQNNSGVYQVSEINIVPDAMQHGNSVRNLYSKLIAGLRKQPGLLQVEVTQQLGQPYNFTLIEQWRDKAALDAASTSTANREFEQNLEPLLSGPVYQRVFKAFE